MRNSQSLPPQQAQAQAAQQAQVAAWQAAQQQAQEQAAQQAAYEAAQQQAAQQAAAQQAAQQAAYEAAQQQAAQQAAWQAQQEQYMAAQQQQQPYYAAGPQLISGRAVGALVCGILAILHFAIPVVGLALAIIAIILAIRANSLFGKTGTAKGGLICGIIGGILSLAVTAAATVGLVMFLTTGSLAFLPFDVSGMTGTSSYGSSSTSAGEPMSDYTDYLNVGEQEAYDALEAKLSSISAGEASALQEIATIADQTFQQAYGTSMASCDIDPLEYAGAMTENFTYDIDTVVIADDASGHSYVSALISLRDVSDVKASFDEALVALDAGTDLAPLSTTDAAAQISEDFMAAVNASSFASGELFSVDLVQSGDTWQIDPTSWTEQLTRYFGLA